MVPKSRFAEVDPTPDGVPMWPILSGQNLDRVELEFPRDFKCKYNLVFVPFLQHQQRIVNTWIAAGDRLEHERSDFAYYEFPTISRYPGFARTFINEGMRSGIPDPAARARTVTMYIEIGKFIRLLDIPGRSEVQVFLVRQTGEIIWRTTGTYSDEKAAGMLSAMEAP